MRKTVHRNTNLKPEITDHARGKAAVQQTVSNEPFSAFRSLLDNLEIGVAHASADGMLYYANPRFAEIIGQPPWKLRNADIRRFIAVASWNSLSEALSRGSATATEGMMNVVSDNLVESKVVRLSFSPVTHSGTVTIEIVATEVTELVQATKALQKSEASLQSASARLLQIQDEERRRLARELHDTTGQELSAAIMSVDGLARSLVDPTGGLRRTALACAERLRKIETQIRTLSYVLHPPLLDEMGLGSALRWFLEGFAKRTGIEVKADIPANVPRFSIEKETALFRVIQEGLTNVFRHSGSRRVTVRLQVKPSAIEALVEDEGKGFSDEGGTPRKHGVGIQSMKGRLEIVGGNLDLHTSSRGTTVVASVPVDLYELMTAPDRLEQRSAENELVAKSRRRILIADDHQVARRGIRTLFDGEPDLEICGEASDGVEALQRTKELKPDLVILDLSMPNMGGLTVANHIRNTGLSTKILVYTSHSYPQLEQTARAAGCDGYVVKSDAAHDLIRATRTVLGGGKFYRSEMGRAQTA